MRLSVDAALNSSLWKAGLIHKLEKLDRALLNSALSYGVYSKNASWYESWYSKRAARPKDYIPTEEFIKEDGNFNADRLYDRAIAALIANKSQPAILPLEEKAQHNSIRYKYDFESQYKNGVYKACDNLSAATAVTSANPDGSRTLHLSFRGTDTKARRFSKYLTKAYLDMSAYYDTFKPFEEAALKFASDPANRISKIEVSGHSLGGAMVQHFFHSGQVKKWNKEHAGVSLEGFTFGSPGAVANSIYAWLPAMVHMVRNANFKNMIETVKEVMSFKSLRRDERITQYQHAGDIVPKISFMVMEKSGKEVITLKDQASKEHHMDFLLTGDKAMKVAPRSDHHSKFMLMMGAVSEAVLKKPIRFVKRVSQTVYHDMARYTVNLDSELTKLKKDNLTHLNEANYNTISRLPNSHSFGLTCQVMRIQYQGQARLLGMEDNFHKSWQEGSKMERMDWPRLVEMRKKMLGLDPEKKVHPYPMYAKV